MRTMKTTLKAGLLASAAVAALAMASPNQANAAAYALVDVEVSNMFISTDNEAFGGPTGAFVFTDRTSSSSDGFAGDGDTDTVTRNSGYSFASPALCRADVSANGCADATVAFSGAGAGPGENGFTAIGKGGDFGYADSSLYDTLINSGDGTAPTGGGGDFDQIAEASRSTNGNSEGQAGSAEMKWTFDVDLGASEDVTLTFDLDGLLQADAADSDAVQARAEYVFKIQLLLEGDLIDSDTFEILRTRIDADTGDVSFGADDTTLTVTTTDSGTYQFVITSIATANASAIPEPGTLALFGGGLLGLGVLGRRRRRRMAA